MNELYAETYVKKKATISTLFAKAGLIVAVLIMFVLSTLFRGQGIIGSVFMMLTCVMVGGLIYIFPKFKVDYEYIFCDGQLDFDVIMGGNKRKTVLRIDFENVEVMAPENSSSFSNYLSRKDTKVKDFSSREPGAKRYVIFCRKNELFFMIIFEPNQKMLNCIKQKAPRKFSNIE